MRVCVTVSQFVFSELVNTRGRTNVAFCESELLLVMVGVGVGSLGKNRCFSKGRIKKHRHFFMLALQQRASEQQTEI